MVFWQAHKLRMSRPLRHMDLICCVCIFSPDRISIYLSIRIYVWNASAVMGMAY